MGEIKADDLILKIEEMINEHGCDLRLAVQVPPGTKCYENSWTQFKVDCISTDGGCIYLQCS